jgi:hypothetical protein
MTIATLLFGFLVSVMFGAGFHLWKDGGPGRLIIYEALSGFGFWSGHSLSNYVFRWDFWNLGGLHLGFAILGTIVFLGFGYWIIAFWNPQK